MLQLEKLLKAADSFFNLKKVDEFTIEAGRPDTIDYDKLAVMSIGAGAENIVKYACVQVDTRSFGRGGGGASGLTTEEGNNMLKIQRTRQTRPLLNTALGLSLACRRGVIRRLQLGQDICIQIVREDDRYSIACSGDFHIHRNLNREFESVACAIKIQNKRYIDFD